MTYTNACGCAHTNTVCVLTGQTFAHAGGQRRTHVCRDNFVRTHSHTDRLCSNCYDWQQPCAAFGRSTDWLWHIFVINLPSDSLSNCAPLRALSTVTGEPHWALWLDCWMGIEIENCISAADVGISLVEYIQMKVFRCNVRSLESFAVCVRAHLSLCEQTLMVFSMYVRNPRRILMWCELMLNRVVHWPLWRHADCRYCKCLLWF